MLSLTLVRMLPIALSLLGSGVRLPTCLFLGWFCPRGLAAGMGDCEENRPGAELPLREGPMKASD